MPAANKKKTQRGKPSSDGFSLVSKVRTQVPNLPYEAMKNAVLGKAFDLSLVFIGPTRSARLNSRRGKSTPTDVLSFGLSETSGEIFICPARAQAKAKLFKKDMRAYTGMLFIHGLYHLKGMTHGSTMEKAEKKMCKKFGV